MITGIGETDRKPSPLPSSELKKPIEIISLSSEEEDNSPTRAMACLQRKDDIKPVEESEDCFILEFDPSQSTLEKNNPANKDVSDLSIIAEKGQVACRDYPHSRHLCLKFLFTTKPHDSYCEMCYCYVCDSSAPCKYWNAHCHAHDADSWNNQRKLHKDLMKVQKQETENAHCNTHDDDFLNKWRLVHKLLMEVHEEAMKTQKLVAEIQQQVLKKKYSFA